MNLEVNLTDDHEIKLGAHTINVRFVDKCHEKLLGDHGCYCHETLTIFIKKDDPESLRFTTYLHEGTHALEQILGFEIDHFHLNLIAEGLASILNSSINKNKIKCLQKQAKKQKKK